MKTLFQSRYTNFIICTDLKVTMQRDKDGKEQPLFTDEKAGIAEHKEFVNQIQFYVHEKDHNGYETEKASCIYLHTDDILLLADEIRKIQKKEIQTEYIESEDLPW